MNTRSVLISIKEIYAQKIQRGEKCVELRRCFPFAKRGVRVYIYVTAPRKRIIGYFVVDNIFRLPVADLWRVAGGSSSLSKDEFYAYFLGKERGVSVHFDKFVPLARDFPLDFLRGMIPGFHPPQSYVYIDRELEDLLLGNASKCPCE